MTAHEGQFDYWVNRSSLYHCATVQRKKTAGLWMGGQECVSEGLKFIKRSRQKIYFKRKLVAVCKANDNLVIKQIIISILKMLLRLSQETWKLWLQTSKVLMLMIEDKINWLLGEMWFLFCFRRVSLWCWGAGPKRHNGENCPPATRDGPVSCPTLWGISKCHLV